VLYRAKVTSDRMWYVCGYSFLKAISCSAYSAREHDFYTFLFFLQLRHVGVGATFALGEVRRAGRFIEITGILIGSQ
jgi:hypothetical protein